MGIYGVFIVFVSVICIYAFLGFKVEQLDKCSSMLLGFWSNKYVFVFELKQGTDYDSPAEPDLWGAFLMLVSQRIFWDSPFPWTILISLDIPSKTLWSCHPHLAVEVWPHCLVVSFPESDHGRRNRKPPNVVGKLSACAAGIEHVQLLLLIP